MNVCIFVRVSGRLIVSLFAWLCDVLFVLCSLLDCLVRSFVCLLVCLLACLLVSLYVCSFACLLVGLCIVCSFTSLCVC